MSFAGIHIYLINLFVMLITVTQEHLQVVLLSSIQPIKPASFHDSLELLQEKQKKL